jgi:hypothetical protein
MSPERHRQRGSVRLQAAPAARGLAALATGIDLSRSGAPGRPSGEEERTEQPQDAFYRIEHPAVLPAEPASGDERVLVHSPPETRISLRPPSAFALHFTREGPLAMLGSGPAAISRPRQIDARMRSIDVCLPHSNYEHPCSVIPDTYAEVALAAVPESPPVHASWPAVTGPPCSSRGAFSSPPQGR